MSKRKWLTAAALFAASVHVGAMTLASHGLGQVLEFPYYTVNANQGTLLTLINSTNNVKAVKARFRESYDGRLVASFNIYLSPHDVWTADVFADADGEVAIGTRDRSCTVPAFDASLTRANIPALAFSTTFISGANNDTGPTDSSRLHEGHFEFFEMGEVSSDAHLFETDIIHQSGVPTNCAAIVAAWGENGTWSANPDTDMSPPTGGLYGSAAIIDVANGTYYALAPTVLDGFSTTVQHSAVAAAAPDFDTANADASGNVAAAVDVGGRVIQLHYKNPVDAVSALLMTTQQLNEYEVSASLGAQSDWVSTFPTKHFYVDPLESDVVAPFDEIFGEHADGRSCVTVGWQIFDRDEKTFAPYSCPWECPPPPPPKEPFCREANVITMSPAGGALHSSSTQAFTPDELFSAGHLVFNFDAGSHRLSASTEGTVLIGLPSIGFVAENFVNANVTPGVLANYSFAIPHRSTVACDTADGKCP